ncbi:MAG: alpha-glucosidase C-terminal domain-containing protein [Phycisphaerae bacterium]|nr:alpha-glucosidase C-terminal domain-containing protein [Phycisphaerae bacterium]
MGPEWLADAVFYQIYPQSFNDSNGDGVGDIPGIISKLDYVQSLGVDALWLNPCFESPFNDAGYDVADYRKVAKRYGTNRDLKRLFTEAHKRGMKVCLDLVVGHTSIEHKWFKESSKANANAYSDYYIWTDDWTADAGNLNTIRGMAGRNGNFVTNFFWSQPALNYGFAKPDPQKPWQLGVHHPSCQAVLQEMIDVMQFWLDLGCDGFRVDMAYCLVKNDPACKQTSKIWRGVRKMLDAEYPQAALIAEWNNPAEAIQAGFHADFMINFDCITDPGCLNDGKCRDPFAYSNGEPFFSKAGKGDVHGFLDTYLDHYHQSCKAGYIALPTGNHDIIRLGQGRTAAELELVFAFLLTMPGVPFIYYGDEIGMDHRHNIPTVEGGYTRTGARTPMQWSPAKNAGFSTAHPSKLYTPVDPDKARVCVADQEDDDHSLLNRVRALVALRKGHKALGGDGHFEVLYAEPGQCPLVYLRKRGRERILIAINPATQPAEAIFASEDIRPGEVLMGSRVDLAEKGPKYHITVPGSAYAVIKV